MSTPDPDSITELTKHLWAALALPLGYVWKKVNGAVQKEDFKEAMRDITGALERHAEQDRETFIKLFERMEKQGDVLSRVDATVTFLRENRDR